MVGSIAGDTSSAVRGIHIIPSESRAGVDCEIKALTMLVTRVSLRARRSSAEATASVYTEAFRRTDDEKVGQDMSSSLCSLVHTAGQNLVQRERKLKWCTHTTKFASGPAASCRLHVASVRVNFFC